MEDNYWARQQRRSGQGFIRFADRDENYWTPGAAFRYAGSVGGEYSLTQP